MILPPWVYSRHPIPAGRLQTGLLTWGDCCALIICSKITFLSFISSWHLKMASQVFKVFSRSLHSSCVKRMAVGAGGFNQAEHSQVYNLSCLQNFIASPSPFGLGLIGFFNLNICYWDLVGLTICKSFYSLDSCPICFFVRSFVEWQCAFWHVPFVQATALWVTQ